jgi:glycosyltransferase involved in cell wall biosynthesis
VFTERDARAAASLAPEIAGRIHVTPFGVEIPEVRAHQHVDQRTVAFLGNYTHAPNVDAALWLAEEIFPRVRLAVPDARLRLAGPHAPASVRALVSPSVEVWGCVADADEFMARAAVIAAPVRIGGGMRVKVVHAMALGKAVVTTGRGAEGLDGVGPLPLVVEDRAEELASAIVRLLVDDDARCRMGAAARAMIVEGYSARAFARRSVSVYTSAIERAGDPCRR